MASLVLRNAEIINEGRRFHADVLIRDGRIERIGAVCHFMHKKTFHFGNAFTLEKQMLEVFA